MNELTTYLLTHGWILTLIAIGGIFILGILKYVNAFKNLNEASRHCIYILISAGFSVIGSAIYLYVCGQRSINAFFAIVSALFALNQTFYNLLKVTRVKDLFRLLLDFIFKHYTKK